MKHKMNLAQLSRTVLWLGLIVCVGLTAARAQTPPRLTPQVTCVAPDPTDPAVYTAYFGYTNATNQTISIPAETSGNFFFPIQPEGGPQNFEPGVHRKVFAIQVPTEFNETWFLEGLTAVANPNANASSPRCAGNFTYQGRLSAAGAAASGQYNLRFQAFDALAGGTVRSDAQTVSATLTNGIFTVQLDSDALFPREQTKALYLEISVSQGSGGFTTLAPRQPVTPVPFAISALTADNATNATNANNAANLGGTAANQFVQTTDARLSDARTPTAGSVNYIQNSTTQQTGNFNVSGGGTVGGNLTANTVNAAGSNNLLLNANSSSAIGTWLTLNNTTSGGRNWSLISTGASNGEGAGKLLLRDSTNGTARLILSDTGASVNGDLAVSGIINGTVGNATNAVNATNVSGGFVQLPLTSGVPPAGECNAASQYGRQKVDATNSKLWICTAAGWKSTVLQ